MKRLSLCFLFVLCVLIPVAAHAQKKKTLTAKTTAHQVSLSWTQGSLIAPPAGTTYQCSNGTAYTLAGNNVYRATTAGGEGKTPYVKLTTPSTSYADTSVTAGQALFYTVTVVDSCGDESVQSNEIAVTIPNNITPPPVPNAPTGLTGTPQ